MRPTTRPCVPSLLPWLSSHAHILLAGPGEWQPLAETQHLPCAFFSTEEPPGTQVPTAQPAPGLLLVDLGSDPGDPTLQIPLEGAARVSQTGCGCFRVSTQVF